MLAEHFSASRKESFMLCWCSIGAITHSVSGHKRGFSFWDTAKKLQDCCTEPSETSQDANQTSWDLFGMLRNFSASRITFRDAEKNFRHPEKILTWEVSNWLREVIFLRKIWQSPWLGMWFTWGVYGENQVGLGLSRPLDGLACPIKLLPERIALILAYFGGSSTTYLLSCLSFRDPAKVMRYHSR